MKILYVENNQSDADLVKRQLIKDLPGCKHTVVSLLSEARKKLPNGNYDLVLLDMHLPDGNGLDLLVEIRQENLPLAVVVLTGSGDEEAAVAALKAGADDYIVKRHGYLDVLYKTIEIALLNSKANYNKKKQTLKVLYAEHNTADIDLTKRHLSRYAPYINLTVCYTAGEVLELLKDINNECCNYDVLLTDYRLTGISGLELVKTVRQIKRLPIAIVMVTGQGDEDIAIQALRLGADDYLVKRSNYLFRLPSMLMSAFQRHELEKKQLELHQSEEKFRRLAENAQDIIYRYDFLPVKKFSFVSAASTKITGYTPEEYYADPELRYKIVHPEDVHYLKDSTNSSEKLLVLRWIKKDGKIIWTEQRNVPVFDEKGNLIAIEGITRDITEQRTILEKLSQERSLLRTLIDNLPDNVYIKDTKMRKILVNKSDLAVIGKSEEEVLGKDDNELFSKEVAASFIADDQLVLEKGQSVINREEHLINNLGQSCWLSTSKLPLYDSEGHITGLIGIGHNITERKQAEELLKERDQKLKEKNEEYHRLNQEYLVLNEELTESLERVQKINEELNISKEKAEESDRLKTAFLANMSHEIRTPMNGILGFTQVLQQTNPDDEKREHYLNVINKSCDRLLSVVNDIIDISQIESGIIDIQYTNVNIQSLLSELKSFYSKSFEDKNLNLTMEIKLPEDVASYNTDEDKLQQILSNLLNNAVKYTEHGDITLACTLKDNMLEFSVKDTGIGIDKNNQSIIFDRFRQADEKYTREFGGSGLGLAIAKAYVIKLGGEIWLESEKGKGSTFYFNIPFIPAGKPEPDQIDLVTSKAYNWVGKKILIAEDEESNYEYLAEVLESTKVTLYHAWDGKEALDLYEQNKPDLILMDIKMPKLDGYQATEKIREKDKKIPIIATTAYAMSLDKETALRSGFNDHIAKPVYFESFLAILNKYL